MSKAALSDFLKASMKYLDIHHGDTETTHPYVSGDTLVAKEAGGKNEIIVTKEALRGTAFAAPAPVRAVMHPSFGDAVTRMYAARRERALRAAKPL